MTSSEPDGGRSRPTVALLTSDWKSSSEEAWLTRQVAGALACVADVHVICPDGRRPRTAADGVFTLHQLGTPIERIAELRRDLLVEALLEASPQHAGPVAAPYRDALDQGMLEPWRAASDLLRRMKPDVVVVAGHRNVGAVSAVDKVSADLPVVLIALGHAGAIGAVRHFDQVIERSHQVLTVTESERHDVVRCYGRSETVHRIGAPLAANSSVLVEPNTWVGDTEYVFVRTQVRSNDTNIEKELSHLIRLRFDERPVGVAFTDGFFVWHEGRLERGWPIERSSDLARLMAWARVTVDLHPGKLFARTCIESLLYGTPIVVPHDSRAREHAQRGQGGLWFDGPAELTWCVEALLDPSTSEVLSNQGRDYGEREFGSTDGFIQRVVGACGLALDEASQRIPAERVPA